jgi:hypothetical protein
MNERGQTPIEWVNWKLEQTTGFSERQTYGEILSLLTGEPFQEPVVEKLPKELEAENLRFAQCRLANAIIAALPQEIAFRESKLSRLANHPSFAGWEKELLDQGFEPAGHSIREGLTELKLSGYTNRKLRLDAVLSAAVDRAGSPLRCEIEAYGADGSVTTIANYHEEEAPDFAPRFHTRHEELSRRLPKNWSPAPGHNLQTKRRH